MRLRKYLLATIAAGSAVIAGAGTSNAWVGGKNYERQQVITTGKAPRMHRTVAWTAPTRAKDLVPAGWNIMWDHDTETPTQLMLPNMVASGSVSSASVAESIARSVMSAHLELLAPGATMDNFTLKTNQLDGDVRTVAFQQVVGGAKVMGATVQFLFKGDRLSLITNLALPHVKVDVPAARLPVAAIHAAATAWLAGDGRQVAPSAVATFAGDRVIVANIHPKLRHGVDIEYTLAETVTVQSTTAEPGRWDVFVDSNSAAAFARRSTLHFATGTIQFNVPIHDPVHGYAAVPAQTVTSTINGAQVTTDDNGVATFTGANPAVVKPGLVGPFVAIVNNGTGGLITDTLSLASGGKVTWDQSATEDNDAQLDSYVFANTANRLREDELRLRDGSRQGPAHGQRQRAADVQRVLGR